MQNLFTFIFYIKRSKANKEGKTNIYLRITVNGKRAELSISRKVDVDKWSSASGKMKGSSSESQQLNKYIDSISNKIYKIHQQLVSENKLISASIIKNLYHGKNENQKMILKIFEDHNIQMEKLVGKDFAEGTLVPYNLFWAQIFTNEYFYNFNNLCAQRNFLGLVPMTGSALTFC